MSSILKALRKLEEEKSRSLGGTPDIARDILKTGPSRKGSPWILIASMAALALASGAAGYLLVGMEETPPRIEPPKALVDMPPAKAHIPAETSIDSSPPSPASPAEAGIPGKSDPPPVHSAQEVEVPPRPALPPAHKVDPRKVKAGSSSKTGNRKAAALPSLKLTGIAFQQDREGRLAVVNDLPVMEGTVIAGARVVEISEDRVRFDYSGRSFEVLLDEP